MLVMFLALIITSIVVGLGIRWVVTSSKSAKIALLFRLSYVIVCVVLALALLGVIVVLF